MAYDKIVLLETLGFPSDLNYHVLYRIPIPSQRQKYYAKPGAATAFLDEADAALNSQLQSGAVLEISDTINLKLGTSDNAAGQEAIKRYNILVAQITTNNPYVRYGTGWDGTSFTIRGVS